MGDDLVDGILERALVRYYEESIRISDGRYIQAQPELCTFFSELPKRWGK